MSFFLCFSIRNYATVALKIHTESLFEPIFLKALNMMDERGRNEVTSPVSSYKLRNTESIRHLTSLFSSTSLIGQFIRHLQIPVIRHAFLNGITISVRMIPSPYGQPDNNGVHYTIVYLTTKRIRVDTQLRR